MTNEVTVSDEGDGDTRQDEVRYLECDDKTYFVAGPSTSFVVQGKQYIEPMVIAACLLNGDDEAAYIPREVTSVTVRPVMPSVHLMDRDKNTTVH